MSDLPAPDVEKIPKARRSVKITDIVFFGILLVVIVVLAMTIMNKLTLKHDVANGRAVADRVVADISKRDGVAVRELGTSTFKSTYSATLLTSQFKSIAPVTSHSRSIDRQTLSNTSSGKTVYIIYKYPTKDLAYYIRIAVVQKSGAWQLTNISGNADESQLIVN